MGEKNKETFRFHYNLEVSNNRCPCGPGSETATVKGMGTIDFIDSIINKYKIRSINDCPCGVFSNWMYLVDLTGIDYAGYDITDEAIERNKVENSSYSFFIFDMVNEDLPKADLIICRDCFFHLSNDFVMASLNRFRSSGATYLLATHHDYINTNGDLTKAEMTREAGFRLINLEIDPFNLGKPIEIHNENIKEYYKPGNNRQLSLWRLGRSNGKSFNF